MVDQGQYQDPSGSPFFVQLKSKLRSRSLTRSRRKCPSESKMSAKSASGVSDTAEQEIIDALGYEVDSEAKSWCETQVQLEASRLREQGIKPLIISVKNFGIVPQDEHKHQILINRIEALTAFDFEKRVKQILVSEAIPYPHKADFFYVNVLLCTENMMMPLLLPYLFSSDITRPEGTGPAQTAAQARGKKKDQPKNAKIRNELKEWLLINSKGDRARLSIHEYHNV
ncbi:uncharacterized protein BJ171DRAFT_495397 [Polychytrium aggregatum]|uniref:uncharacterized protein n=1 Tax=Polychytrium aggregatum TaxID=110093 RepID=UPI0022FE0014|nr:uncharacterized protein BJ171DRAFT_495397 [Polychytrium aggregatum]KAI9206994.1 hypothetical protein BJ171DRAFT_495397 [Polychytrium aggregatum]